MPPSNPVIVVPGITASYLRDQYSLPPEIIWSVMRKSYDRAALHPDDLRYEAKEPARVVADQLFQIAYQELIEELRYNLRDKEEETVPVYPFGYDWRQPLDAIEPSLDEFIEEVIDRTKLQSAYDRTGYDANPKVNLVGHSMGGLVIAGYLEKFGGKGLISKVATIASPFQGSFEPVIKVTTGTANLGTSPPSSREREAARLTPALYHLVPSFRRGLDFDPALPKSLFNPSVWQPSIIDTIAEFYRLHGLTRDRNVAELKRLANRTFAKLLRMSQMHRRRLNRLDLANAGLSPKDWLCLIGVDAVTRVRLKIVKVERQPDFSFRSSDRANLWETGANAQERRFTGDGTVPFEGAIPKFLPYESLVCLSPEDFGYWELADKLTVKVGGYHGIMPNMNVIHRLIVRHFTGRPDRHGNTWGRLPPGVDKLDWESPIPGLQHKDT